VGPTSPAFSSALQRRSAAGRFGLTAEQEREPAPVLADELERQDKRPLLGNHCVCDTKGGQPFEDVTKEVRHQDDPASADGVRVRVLAPDDKGCLLNVQMIFQAEEAVKIFLAGVELSLEMLFVVFQANEVIARFDVYHVSPERMERDDVEFAFISAIWLNADPQVPADEVSLILVPLADQPFEILHNISTPALTALALAYAAALSADGRNSMRAARIAVPTVACPKAHSIEEPLAFKLNSCPMLLHKPFE
jgi:hypothetical protein